MNARGLLGVRREHIKVFYNLNRDRSLPQAAELQKALATYMRANLPDGWEDALVRIFKGFTHFNRLAIILRLAKGEATLPELERAAGTIVKSTYHHLRFLYAAGVVDAYRVGRGKSLYFLKEPTHPVTKVLLRQVLGEEHGGRHNNNPLAGRLDKASRIVLAKIRREEGVTATNWRNRRGTGVSHKKLSPKAQRAIMEV
jgi:DNA-binding transcriptional ArsR family regulator